MAASNSEEYKARSHSRSAFFLWRHSFPSPLGPCLRARPSSRLGPYAACPGGPWVRSLDHSAEAPESTRPRAHERRDGVPTPVPIATDTGSCDNAFVNASVARTTRFDELPPLSWIAEQIILDGVSRVRQWRYTSVSPLADPIMILWSPVSKSKIGMTC